MGGHPILFGNGLHQLFLRLFHRVCVRQPQPVADPEHMGIHRDGGHAEGIGQHHVSGLAAHAGQGLQRVHIPGHLPAVLLADHPAAFHDIRRLAFEAAAFDHRINVLHAGRGHAFHIGIALKQRRSDLVHLLVGTLGGEHHRHQRFIGIAEVQLRPRVRIGLFQLGQNGLFGDPHGGHAPSLQKSNFFLEPCYCTG